MPLKPRLLAARLTDSLRRRPAVARMPGAPRIAVVGNCQAAAVASAARLLLPGGEVALFSAYGLTKRHPTLAGLAAELRGFDAVFGGAFPVAFRGGGDFEALREATRLRLLPTIVFPAFHPDVVYAGNEADLTGRGLVRSAVGHYNSAIALTAFRLGLSVEQTLRLFDPALFRLLGYLDMWAGSQGTLLGLGRDAGWDLEADLMRWTRRGAFMHTINHPKMYVAADLARSMLRQAGIDFSDCDLDSYAVDEFIPQGSWPVYGPVAAHYGVPGGSYVFLTRTKGRRGGPCTLTLRDFVAESFAGYRLRPMADLTCRRVEANLASDAVMAAFREVAGRG